MQETVQDSIIRLLRYQRVPLGITREFRSWKHNSDILPKLQSQLEMVLEAYGKFQPIVYDTQGINDDGVDIALPYWPEGNSDQKSVIGFQVKSFDDLAKADYLRSVKAQHDDAYRKVSGLSYYFVLLCTDATLHKDKIRQIESEYRSDSSTEIVEPQYAYTFLHHPKTRVEALIKRVFEAEDLVFKRALETLDQTSPTARALAIFLTVKYTLTGHISYSSGSLLRERTLQAVYDHVRTRQEELLDGAHQAALEREIAKERGQGEEAWYDDDADPPKVAEFEQQVVEDLELIDDDVVEVDSSLAGCPTSRAFRDVGFHESMKIVRLRAPQLRSLHRGASPHPPPFSPTYPPSPRLILLMLIFHSGRNRGYLQTKTYNSFISHPYHLTSSLSTTAPEHPL